MAKKEQPTTNPSNFQVLKDSPIKTVRERFAEKTAPVYKSGAKKGQKRKDDWSPPAYPSSPIDAKPEPRPAPKAGPALNPTGSNPLGSQPMPAPRTTSEGLPIGRRAGTTATRGHGSAAALAAEVDRHLYLFGSVRHPSPATVAVTRDSHDFKVQDIGLGTDVQPRDKAGMEAKRQISAIATPTGLKGDRLHGARGDLAGKTESEITRFGLVEERTDLVAGMMKGSEVRPPSPDKVAKFRMGEQTSPIDPKMMERLKTVTVSKGEVQTDESGRERLVPKGRRTSMKESQHAERAKKRNAKRKKAEGGN